jgi:HAD superfamily hydrolase (TIGR01549 family)
MKSENQIKITTLAVDLIDTLVARGRETFFPKAVELLAAYGIRQSVEEFYRIYRKRYLEYSMGNYRDDISFYKALFPGNTHLDYEELSLKMMGLILECSPPFRDSTNFLRVASKKFRIFLSSNYVLSWAKRIIERNKWEEYFDGFIISSQYKYRKPAYDFFLELIKKCKVKNKSEILLVGDSYRNDFWGAQNAGLKAVLLNRSVEGDLNNFPAGKNFTVSSLTDMLSILETKLNLL